MYQPDTFASFLLGGFECSTHRRDDGRRLDLLAATAHDRFVDDDYRALQRHGIRTVRDGVRWYRIETSPGRYDWSSFLPMLRAARAAGTQVIWDLCHYGWPDDLDIWRPEFVDRMASFAGAVARLVRDEGGGTPFYCPVNEIAYWSWAAADNGQFEPLASGRGFELKVQLVRASIAAIEAIRDVDPRARLVQIDPLINVVAGSPDSAGEAARYSLIQYQTWDMLAGTLWPQLGGDPKYLDIVGLNYYSDNQWFVEDRRTVTPDFPLYRPLRDLLAQTYRRFDRPLLIAETGAEADRRQPWLRYVCDETCAALAADVPVEGICLYPVTDYPGWVDERHCEVGLLGYADGAGQRPVYAPLADELRRQQSRFRALRDGARPQAAA